MKYIFHFNIIVVIVALTASLNTNAYAKNTNEYAKKSGNPIIIKNLHRLAQEIKDTIAQSESDVGDALAEHDTDIKADISTHDGNMTTEHVALDTKLDEILSAVQNGGGTGPEAPVEKTGQTTSFETGDDGELESGVTCPNPRFTDNLDGTITDNLTNLIWDKNANRFGTRNWDTALRDCNNLADNGVDLTDGSVAGDWHLANRFELESLLHMGGYGPAVPDTLGTGQWSQGDPFNNVQSTFYWSSSTVASFSTTAWFVNFFNGVVDGFDKDVLNYVWCVRSGK